MSYPPNNFCTLTSSEIKVLRNNNYIKCRYTRLESKNKMVNFLNNLLNEVEKLENIKMSLNVAA